MKNAFAIVVLCLLACPSGVFTKDQAATRGPSTYTRPEKAVKPDAQATAALLAAKTVAIIGIDAAVLEKPPSTARSAASRL